MSAYRGLFRASFSVGRPKLSIALFLAAFFLNSVSAMAAISPLEVREYGQDFGVSPLQAEARLEIQKQGAGIVNQLRQALGDRYAGVWFDNEAGEFVVPVVPGVDSASVHAQMAGAGLARSYRTTPATSSLQELEAAHEHADAQLVPFLRDGKVRTYLDPRINAVVVQRDKSVTPPEREEIADVATAEVKVRSTDRQGFSSVPLACSFSSKACDKPMRGGVSICPSGEGICAPCTAGFKATGNASGNRFVLTAGHCGNAIYNWKAEEGSWPNDEHYLGFTEQSTFPGNGDWAKIKVNGTWWDSSPWPSMVAYWGTDLERSINSEAYSYLGQYVCHVGYATVSSCGYVTKVDATIPYAQGPTYHMVEFGPVCASGGDSGGPVFAGNTALGIFSGGDNELPECANYGIYAEIPRAADDLGVSVGTRIGGAPGVATCADSANLFGADLNGTGTGKTEVHVLDAATNYATFSLHTGTGLEETGPQQWQLAPADYNCDGQVDLFGVAMNNTGSGKTEVHILNGAGNYSTFMLHAVSGLHETGPENWQFIEGYWNGDSVPDLLAINLNGTGTGKTEVHILDGASNYSNFSLHASTALEEVVPWRWQFAPVDWNSDGKTDVLGVHMNHTGSGMTEVHILDGASNYSTFIDHAATALHETGTESWQFSTGDYNQDGVPDLYAVNLNKTGTGKTEVHILDGASNFSSFSLHNSTGLEETDPRKWQLGGAPSNGGWLPVVATQAPSARATEGATLNGTVSPQGLSTGYHFEYGPTTSYGTNDPNPDTNVGSGYSTVSTSRQVIGLGPERRYHFRIAAANEAGTSNGDDQSFTTLARQVTHEMAFGSAGSANGQLARPLGLARDSQGNVWVADADNNRIQKFNAKGEYIFQFGSKGSAAGQLNEPRDVAIGPDGNVWVTDSINGRIQKFSPQGQFLEQAGGPEGSQNVDHLQQPYGIEVTAQGDVYVTDVNGHDIDRFEDTYEGLVYDRSYSSIWNGGPSLGYPAGIVLDRQGDLWIADATTSYLYQLLPSPPQPRLVAEFKIPSDDHQPAEPRGIAIRPSDTIAVAEKGNSRVQLFSVTGELLGAFGTKGSAAGQMTEPRGIIADGGALFVTDTGNNRIQKWLLGWEPGATTQAASNVTATTATLNGAVDPRALATTYRFEYGKTTAYGQSIPVPNESVGSGTETVSVTKAVSGLHPEATYHYRVAATNSEGTTYGADARFVTPAQPATFSFSFAGPGSGTTAESTRPLGVQVDASGNVWVVDREKNRVAKYNSQGQYLTQITGLKEPRSIDIGPDGHLWVTDFGNARLVEYMADGTFVRALTEKLSGPYGIAVDDEGRVWVSDINTNKIVEFKQSGESYPFVAEVASVGGQPMSVPAGLDVDSEHNLWIAEIGANRISEFEKIPNGTGFNYRIRFGNSDPSSEAGKLSSPFDVKVKSSGNLLVVDRGNNRIQQFTQDGDLQAVFGGPGSGAGQFNEPSGVALAGGGVFYVTDSGNKRVQRWRVEPDISTQLAGMAITEAFDGSSASLSRFNTNWSALGWAAGTPAKGENTTSGWRPVNGYPTVHGAYLNTAFTDTGSGLATVLTMAVDPGQGGSNPGRFFSLWLDMSSPAGSRAGYELRFTNVGTGKYDATLSKWQSGTQTVLASQAATSIAKGYSFALVDQGATVSAWSNSGSGFTQLMSASDSSFSAGESGLAGAGNFTRLTSFKTGTLGPSKPDATTLPASGISATGASLNGNVHPGSLATTYRFEYGTTTAYGSKAPAEAKSIGSGTDAVAVSEGITGLKSHQTYHFRVNAENSEGTTYGKDETFTTAPTYIGSYGSAGSGNGQFSGPYGIGVEAGGNVLVADAGNNRVEKFNSKGEYLSQFGSYGSGNGQLKSPGDVAIDSSGNYWVVDVGNARVEKFNSKGEYLSQFGSYGHGNGQFIAPDSVAIAPNGHIWVSDWTDPRVQEFTASGEFVQSVSGGWPASIAADQEGNIWVANFGAENDVKKLDPKKGAYVSSFGSWGNGPGQFEGLLAIDVMSSGNLLVADRYGSRVQELTSSGQFVTQFGPGFVAEPNGIGVGSGGAIYVSNTPNNNFRKWCVPAPPEASAQAASDVATAGATLNASVNPHCVATKYQFEYGTTTAYGSKAPAEAKSIGSGTDAVAVSEAITGLQPGTTYHFRVVAENGEGTTPGEDRTFTTSTTAEWLSSMAVTEPFNGGTESLANFASQWSALGWAGGGTPKGSDTTAGWRPVDAYSTVNGTYYTPTVTDTGPGIATVATMAVNPLSASRYFSLGLDMSSPSSTRSGYELRFTDTSTNTYEVKLSKWVSGTQTVLATKSSYSFVNGNSFALVDQGSTVSAWTNTGSGFNQILSASDSSFEGGKAGVEGSGNITRLTNFKVGSL